MRYTKGLPGKENLKKKCPNCNKKREPRLFPEGEKICLICQVPGAKKIVTQVSLPSLKNSVQRLVNKYARLRDSKDGCISCLKGKSDEGGHYLSVGANSALRFNLDNIHGQCTSCNRWLHGNPLEYRIRLVQKIGEEKVNYLEAHRKDTKKWDRGELLALQEEYKQKIKEMV